MRAALTALCLVAAATHAAPDAGRAGPFDYDASTPLDVRETGVERRGGVTVQEISYASPKGGRVPATLVVPDGKGPFAAVIWGHWYWENSEFRNRRQFLAEAVALAPSGVVSLLTDGPAARPGHVPDRTPLNTRQMTDLVQQVVDMRRGADLLLARKDVDPRRLGYVGHSYNASVGGILSGIDRRFAAFVLMAGGLSDEADRKLPAYRTYREKVGAAKFDAFFATHSWADPGAYVSRAAPAFVFLQYATEEDFLTPEHVREYVALVSDPKRFVLYEAPHALNAAARRDRIAFLCEQLCVPPPSPAAVAAISDLPQPAPPGPPAQEGRGARAWRLAGLRDERGRIDPLGPARARSLLSGRPGRLPLVSFAAASGRWVPRGPTNRGGRARALVIHPVNPLVMWAATGSGGVWKTVDGGNSWRPLTDALGLPSGCLALDPSNPDHLYWGTGERYHAGGPGAGVFESIDGGESWTQLPGTAAWRYVHRIAISRSDPKRLLASVPDADMPDLSGFFLSTDGGASWERVLLTYSDTMDVEFDPTDPSHAVAAAQDDRFGLARYSIFHSRDGGRTWTASEGGTVSQSTRWTLAIAPSRPSVVYAFGESGLYRSGDGGATFAKVRDARAGYGAVYWANVLWVSPTDPDVVLAGGVLLARSTDGGATFEPVDYYDDRPDNPFADVGHEDQQEIVADPGWDGVSNRRVYLLNDGGIDRIDDILASPVTAALAHSLDGGMQTTEVYTVAGRASDGLLLQAVQDSGVEQLLMPSTRSPWAIGGDGTCTLIDPVDGRYLYGCFQYLDPFRIESGGRVVRLGQTLPDAPYPDDRNDVVQANFVAPVLLDPNAPSRMIAGGRSLWRCDNIRTANDQDVPAVWAEIKPRLVSEAALFDACISAVAIAPGDSNVLWVGHNDGRIYRTSDGLSAAPHWAAVDDNASTDPLPNRMPLRIVVDRGDPARVWIAFGGFSAGNLWRTDDAGATWRVATGAIDAVLPEAPVWALVQHPDLRDTLYAGTEAGVFASGDAGASWVPISAGSFAVAVQDLAFLQGSGVLLAGTFGRGSWTLETKRVPPPYVGPPPQRRRTP